MMIMIVMVLLLLLLSLGLCGTPDCTFPHSPISSTFADTIRKLVSAPLHPLLLALLSRRFCC